jgi:uncharacterized protein (TIGR03435 family)
MLTTERALTAVVVIACASRGQSTQPRFEVTSVKPHAAGFGPHIPGCMGERFTSSVGFGNLLQWAYDLRGREGSELLPRVASAIGQFYDIEAKAAGPIASESQCRLMVQALLADRFKMAVHWESRDGEVADLVVARGGPKMQKALPTDAGRDIDIVVDGKPIVFPPGPGGPKGYTMEQLAAFLTVRAADLQQITNKTGLEGPYRIDLRFSNSLAADSQDPVDPPLDAALAQQLGLRLEKRKGSVKVLVLDHIEKPDAN